MKTLILLLGATAIVMATAAEKTKFITSGQPAAGKQRTAPGSSELSPSRGIIYRPPSVGAPRITTYPGTRGTKANGISLSLLTPDHVALTTMIRPRLYWHHNDLPAGRVEITLVEPRRAEPLLQCIVTNARSARVEQLALDDYGVDLKPDVVYQWSVAWVLHPEYRSKDLVAMGAIRLTSPLTNIPPHQSPSALAATYAENGIWYDAVSTLMTAAQTGAQPRIVEGDLRTLLGQVGLTNIPIFFDSQESGAARSENSQ